MKSKKNIYILLPLVLLIWCVIVYKIYVTLHKPEEKVVYQASGAIQMLAADTVSQDYALILHYPDPFRTQNFQPKAMSTPEIAGGLDEETQTAAVVEESLPDIQYSGMIEHAISADRVAMLVVDGKAIMAKVGKFSEDIQVKAITPQLVDLIYKGKRMQIKLQYINDGM